MLRKDERGFTLVELVISMGMFSIVLIAIMIFMTSGARSYQYTKTELDLQQESQMLINQIRDMIYTSNYAEYDDTKHALTLYQIKRLPSSTAGSGSSATPVPASKQVTNKKVIYWDDASEKLYLEELSDDSTPSYPKNDDHLFSRYMTGFSATVNKNDVQLKITMKNSKNKYELNEGVTIRNGWVTYP